MTPSTKTRNRGVFPRQGHDAHSPDVATYPAPDLTIERIGDTLDHNLQALLHAARKEGTS